MSVNANKLITYQLPLVHCLKQKLIAGTLELEKGIQRIMTKNLNSAAIFLIFVNLELAFVLDFQNLLNVPQT